MRGKRGTTAIRVAGRCALGLGLAGAGLGACSPSTGDGSGPGGGAGTQGGGFGGAGAVGAGANPGQGGAFASTGGIGVFFRDTGAPTGSGGTDGGCGGQLYEGEIVPLDIYIMFDQSKSMSCTIGGASTGDRWTAVKTALTSFVQSPGAATIDVGIGYFGIPPAAPPPAPQGSSCDPALYKPDVDIGPLSQNASAIVASLNNHSPSTDTPTLPAIQSAITHAIDWKGRHPGHTVVVVLVTDGEPNACGANNVTEVAKNVGDGFTTGGIPTYVIGILSPGSTCPLDPNMPNQADLDTVAKAGGTNTALIVDTTNAQQDAGAQFLATMNNIRQNAQIPCEYAIPKPTTGSVDDPGFFENVNLDVKDPSGAVSPIYPAPQTPTDQVGWAGHESCASATSGGWYYDTDPHADGGHPTKIILCKSTCDTVTSKFGYAVSIKLGCPTVPPPH